MPTYRQKADVNESRMDRELDEHLSARDMEDTERRECPFGPGDACDRCPRKIKERCNE